MNIALYLDPNISPISTFYTIIELKKYIELEYNYKFDIFIPYTNSTTTNNDDCWVTYHFSIKYNYTIIWNRIPDPNKYNVLCISHIWNKKWNGIDNRIVLVDLFLKYKRQVISLKMDTTMEHRFLNNDIFYGVNSLYQLKLDKRWILPKKSKQFIFHQISNLSIPKPNRLSQIEFMEKYKLMKNRKIILFLMGRFQKWYNVEYINSKNMNNFLLLLPKINSILEKNNCQLIFKLHRSDSISLINTYNLHNLIIIDSYDTHEAILYSDYAITYGSTIVYELYLYNLPVLELGYGIYFPGWVTYLNKKYPIKCLQEYNFGRDLIYGIIVGDNDLIDSLLQFIDLYKNTRQDTNINYNFKKHHPIFGDSYENNTIDKIATSLIEKIKLKIKK